MYETLSLKYKIVTQEISQEEIEDVAALAQIALTEEEITHYQKDLGSILTYFEKLQELNTDDVEEIGYITGMTDVYREDEVNSMRDAGKDAILENVPAKEGRHIKVKNVL